MSTQTTTQVVYRGHDNTTELFITRYVGRRYEPMDFSGVTRMVLSMPEASPNPYVFDTADLPGVIEWSGAPGSVMLNLQEYDIPSGVYVVSLVAYSPEWPNGYVVIDSRPSAFGELTFVEFRTVIGSGVLPPPIPGPPAGAVEIRFNGVPVVSSASVMDFTGSVEVEAAGGGAVTVNVTGGGGSSGVESFNTRTGAVTLQGSDVTTALEYTPVNPSSLATVATSGAYADLSGRPTLAAVATSGAYADLTGRPTLATVATTGAYADLSGLPVIPSTPGDIGAATAAQGALAETALQPEAAANQLSMPTARILGRWTSGDGAVQYITLGTNLTLTAAGVLNATSGGGGGGRVDEVVAGTGITVNDTDPTAPVVSLSSAALASLGNADNALQPGDAATALNMSTARLLGRTTASTGAVEEITVGAGLSLAAGQLSATGGAVDSVEAGTGIAVDATDPTAPAVALSAGTQAELAKIGDVEAALRIINGKLVDPATTEWGTITGVLSDQTDLQAALGEKADKTALGSLSATVDGKVDLNGLPSRTVTASGAITVADAGRWLVCTNGGAITLTIGAEASGAWPSGVLSTVHILQTGGAVTIAGSGFSVNTHARSTAKTDGTGSVVTLLRTGPNTWWLFGRLVAV